MNDYFMSRNNNIQMEFLKTNLFAKLFFFGSMISVVRYSRVIYYGHKWLWLQKSPENFFKYFDMTKFQAFESRGCSAVRNLSEPAELQVH
jgi:hypothetical protein